MRAQLNVLCVVAVVPNDDWKRLRRGNRGQDPDKNNSLNRHWIS
jgi:hypothetical protein